MCCTAEEQIGRRDEERETAEEDQLHDHDHRQEQHGPADLPTLDQRQREQDWQYEQEVDEVDTAETIGKPGGRPVAGALEAAAAGLSLIRASCG